MEVNLLSGALGAEVYGISLKDSSEKNWKLINNLMGKNPELRLKFISENAGKNLNLDV